MLGIVWCGDEVVLSRALWWSGGGDGAGVWRCLLGVEQVVCRSRVSWWGFNVCCEQVRWCASLGYCDGGYCVLLGGAEA